MEKKMNLSFAGCGFLGIYHIGVAGCFKKYAPHLISETISGASAGAITACCLLCDLPLGELTTITLKVVKQVREKLLGPFSPSFNVHKILQQGLEKGLPEDAHLRVSGKLHISMTRVYDSKNVVVSEFSSREELIQALLASAFIPVFSGFLPPKFRGVRYMDGGFSDNLPVLDENTITVSPFCGESDICPRDVSSQLFHFNYSNTSIELSKHNFCRFGRILFPPEPEVLSNMCKQGFDDALRFLQRNDLLSCRRCLAVQSTFVVSHLDEAECSDCQEHRKEALVSDLPDTIASILQDAIESANKGVMNWLFQHRSVKLLSLLSLPCTLPADIVYATFTNVLGGVVQTHSYEMFVVGNSRFDQVVNCDCAEHSHFRSLRCSRRFLSLSPSVGSNLKQASHYLLDQLSHFVHSVDLRRQQITANISCQLAILQYADVAKLNLDILGNISRPVKNRLNFNFSLSVDERDVQVEPGRGKYPSKVLSRRSSESLMGGEKLSPVEDDTFDHILQVTSHHDAVMAYYYTDEDNKVKVTEIFDVTEEDDSIMLTAEEKQNNTQLQFEDDWEDSEPTSWLSQHTLLEDDDDVYYSQLSCDPSNLSRYEEDLSDRGESPRIFSDPESEWAEPGDRDGGKDCSVARFLPESEQAGQTQASEDQHSRHSAS
ncbi:patanin-like phospholipase domain-containing protein atgl-1 isoform X2 [Bacillus rossius redtenbacheri]|uniref:patanin-like phospholipase domain-containing protein atgl-1 isoform X2 n=1 Tax=Bacillus rossius redtenbacheri TaxID=93214 RepID=UPI002FDD1B36